MVQCENKSKLNYIIQDISNEVKSIDDKKNRTLSILSIAGSDNSCGAGIQADIKTAHSLNSYCLTVVTSVTSQNSQKFLVFFPCQ